MGELAKLPNIGKTVEEQLNRVGITTVEELKAAGAKQAWLNSQAAGFGRCDPQCEEGGTAG